MKPHFQKNTITLTAALLLCMAASSQLTPLKLDQFISTNKAIFIHDKFITGTKIFYEQAEYKLLWLDNDSSNYRDLVTLLKQSAGLGLRPSDYGLTLPDSTGKVNALLQSGADPSENDIRITAIAIHFFNDLAYGNTMPELGYNGLNYSPNCYDVPVLLAKSLLQQSLPSLLNSLTSSMLEISLLETKITWLTAIIADSNFSEVQITSTKISASNKSLLQKLYQLGILDSVSVSLTDQQVREAVKEAQRQFVLLPDGILRPTVMEQLNIRLATRLQQLQLAINYYRWLQCLPRQQGVIVVNIPSTYMKVYRNDSVILEMRMVLGKPATPTPTLTSRVSEVILYPYWHVPHSIATKELLPLIKKNPGVLNEGNFQVLGKDGTIMDPYKINWQVLSIRYFPYLIRQSTGCDNALGLLKLNFYSPFGVYLHDTPYKGAFILNKRYFSHGCLRMESPMELGHLILKNNAIAIDTLEQKGCLRNQAPVQVAADESMPVVVWYNPAGTDSTGRVLYFDDVYKKFAGMRKK